MTECTIPICSKPTVAKGLCMKHYRRQLRHGTTELHLQKDQPCSVEGCHHKLVSADYCANHFRRLKLYGNPLYEAYGKAKGQTCQLELCSNPVRSKGLCATHYTGLNNYKRTRPGATTEDYLAWKNKRMKNNQSL